MRLLTKYMWNRSITYFSQYRLESKFINLQKHKVCILGSSIFINFHQGKINLKYHRLIMISTLPWIWILNKVLKYYKELTVEKVVISSGWEFVVTQNNIIFYQFIRYLSFCLAYIWNIGYVLLIIGTTHIHQHCP